MSGRYICRLNTNVLYLEPHQCIGMCTIENGHRTKIDDIGQVTFKYNFDINSIKTAMLLNEVLNIKANEICYCKSNDPDSNKIKYFIRGGGLFIEGHGYVYADPINGVGMFFRDDISRYIRSVTPTYFKTAVMKKLAIELEKYYVTFQAKNSIEFTSQGKDGEVVTVTVTKGEYKALYNYLMGKTSKKSHNEYSEKDYESMVGTIDKNPLVDVSLDTCRQRLKELTAEKNAAIQQLNDCMYTTIRNFELNIRNEFEEKIKQVKDKYSKEIEQVNSLINQLFEL